jgi:hypothetical protein
VTPANVGGAFSSIFGFAKSSLQKTLNLGWMMLNVIGCNNSIIILISISGSISWSFVFLEESALASEGVVLGLDEGFGSIQL